jgi:hypothetical protein
MFYEILKYHKHQDLCFPLESGAQSLICWGLGSSCKVLKVGCGCSVFLLVAELAPAYYCFIQLTFGIRSARSISSAIPVAATKTASPSSHNSKVLPYTSKMFSNFQSTDSSNQSPNSRVWSCIYFDFLLVCFFVQWSSWVFLFFSENPG